MAQGLADGFARAHVPEGDAVLRSNRQDFAVRAKGEMLPPGRYVLQRAGEFAGAGVE